MTHVRTLIAAGAMTAVGVIGGGVGIAAAAAPSSVTTTSGSDLNADMHLAEVGEHATANDVESAAEDIDDGSVTDVDSQDNQTGTVETGTANDVSEPSADTVSAPETTSSPDTGDSGTTGVSGSN